MRGFGRLKPLIPIDNQSIAAEVACAAEACIFEIEIRRANVA
jgi:hypothetical protein